MAYCGYVATINEINKHPNADRLQIVKLFNTQSVVDLTYYKGQKIVYFPEGGTLNEDYAKKCNLLRIKNEDGTYSGGYLDPNKIRITTVRLRGEVSDGLILPIETLNDYVDINTLKNGDKIDILGGILLCQKYIPKTPKGKVKGDISQNYKKNKKEEKEKISYPYFLEHEDTKQLMYNMNSFHEGDLCTISLKMHGCFSHNTRVRLWNELKSKKITDIKVGDYIIGYKNGQFVPTKVLNIFNNGKGHEWRKIWIERKGMKGDKKSQIICTPEHLFFDFKNNNYKEAQNLIVGEKISMLKKSIILSDNAKEILLGLYLGDGYYEKNHSYGTGVLQTSYKEEHYDYLLWIQKCLGPELFYIDTKKYISGYGTTMRRGKTYAIADLKNYFNEILDISDSENKLTEKIIDYFSWKTAAFLIMDDGSLAHNDIQQDRCLIAICDYNDHDANIIIKCFNKLGVYPVLYNQDGYNRLRFNLDDANFVFKNISPYICNCMKYKLPVAYRDVPIDYNIYEKNEVGYVLIENKIILNEPIYSKKGKTKYDLQTETGNYVVGDVLVHNSSGRITNTIELIKKYPNRFLKLFGKKPIEKRSWKIMSGTRRVILKESTTDGYYGSNEFRKKYEEQIKNNLPKGMTIYGEIVGWVNETTPIMGRCSNKKLGQDFVNQYGPETIFDYGCNIGESDFYTYRITMTNEDGYKVELSTSQAQIESEKLGLKFVPVFETFTFTTVDDLLERVNKYVDGRDLIGNHIREGIVIRIENRDNFTAFKFKNDSFKILSGIISENMNTENITEDMINEMA